MKPYFSHDADAASDEKCVALQAEHGLAGYGLYWRLVERLRGAENDYTCVANYNLIAYDLRCSSDLVKAVVEDFGLFSFTENGERFYSESLMRRMRRKDEISEARKHAAQTRWSDKGTPGQKNTCKCNANASKIKCKSNANASKNDAIKENKSKENKSKIKENTPRAREKIENLPPMDVIQSEYNRICDGRFDTPVMILSAETHHRIRELWGVFPDISHFREAFEGAAADKFPSWSLVSILKPENFQRLKNHARTTKPKTGRTGFERPDGDCGNPATESYADDDIGF